MIISRAVRNTIIGKEHKKIYVNSADYPNTWDNPRLGKGVVTDDLQWALDNIALGGKIYLARGTYKPTKVCEYLAAQSGAVESRCRTFDLSALINVDIYGGLLGTETTLEINVTNGRVASYDPWTKYQFAYPSILNGDFTGNDEEKSYQVVHFRTLTPLNSSAVSQVNLDGCVISGGNANGLGILAQGASIYAKNNNYYKALSLRNCTIENCKAVSYSLYIYVILSYVSFSNNYINLPGFLSRISYAKPINCTIINSYISINTYGGSDRNIFLTANSPLDGYAQHFTYHRSTNSLYITTEAYISSQIKDVYNIMQISDNVDMLFSQNPTTFHNCIMLTKVTLIAHDSIDIFPITVNFNNSFVKELVYDPAEFIVNHNNPISDFSISDLVDVENNDYSLNAWSKAINAGNNANKYGTLDLVGSPRIHQSTIDAGCYEFPHDVWSATIRVLESGVPKVGAKITVSMAAKINHEYITDSNGEVTFQHKAGVYPYLITMDGYKHKYGTITISDADISQDDSIVVGSVVKYSGGTGVSGDEYILATLDDLRTLSEDSSDWSLKEFKLALNIEAADTATWNSGLGFSPIGDSTTRFSQCKIISDNNHNTISGLVSNRPGVSYVGFIGYAQDSVFMNIRFDEIELTGGYYVAPIAVLELATVDHITPSIQHVHSANSIINAARIAGGICAFLANTRMTLASCRRTDINCVADNTYNPCGGLVGRQQNAIIDESFTEDLTLLVTGEPAQDAGGLTGMCELGSKLNNVYALNSNVVSTQAYTGGLIGRYHQAAGVDGAFVTGFVNSPHVYRGAMTGRWEETNNVNNIHFDSDECNQTDVLAIPHSQAQWQFMSLDDLGFDDTIWEKTGRYPDLKNNSRY